MWTSFMSMRNKNRLGGFLGYDGYGKGVAIDIVILELCCISFGSNLDVLDRFTLRSGTEQTCAVF